MLVDGVNNGLVPVAALGGGADRVDSLQGGEEGSAVQGESAVRVAGVLVFLTVPFLQPASRELPACADASAAAPKKFAPEHPMRAG